MRLLGFFSNGKKDEERMISKISNWIIKSLAVWGLVVIGILIYQFSHFKTPEPGPSLIMSSYDDVKRDQQITLLYVDRDYTYLQKKGFLKHFINMPLAVMKYDWKVRFYYGIEFNYDWLWLPKYKDQSLYIQSPRLKLMKMEILSSQDPEVLQMSLFYSQEKMFREFLQRRPKKMEKEANKLLGDPQLKDMAQKALGEVFLHFLRQLDLKETIHEVMVQIPDGAANLNVMPSNNPSQDKKDE